jgi:CheY-like chemotaxis protein
MAELTEIADNSYIDNSEKTGKYYSIFLNAMASVAKGFDAKIIKNVGDGLVCYFPKTSDRKDDSAFQDVIGFGVTAMAARRNINRIIHEKLSFAINYRISIDYGKVEVAETVASGGEEDLFGSPMNLCAKINTIAPINGIAIGHNLYQIIKSLFSESFSFHSSYSKYYDFEQIGEYTWKEERSQQHISYPVYSIITNKDRTKEDFFVNQRLELKQKNSRNIVIVDDERDILLTYNSMLYEEGYKVETFSNPHEALLHFAHADKYYYDLVILDIRMPSLNGLQLYHRLKAIDKDIKILFLSALEVSEEIVSIYPELKHGNIIRKPVTKDYFVEKINALLQ